MTSLHNIVHDVLKVINKHALGRNNNKDGEMRKEGRKESGVGGREEEKEWGTNKLMGK